MKVGVQPELVHLAGACVALLDCREDVICDGLVSRMQLIRNEFLVHQILAGCNPVTIDIDGRSVRKLARLADQVYSRNQTSELSQQIKVVEIGCPAPMARKDGESKRSGVVQSSTGKTGRGDDGQLAVTQFYRKVMFFDDGVIAPTARPIEFGDNGSPVFDANLIDAVFITVQRQKSTVTA